MSREDITLGLVLVKETVWVYTVWCTFNICLLAINNLLRTIASTNRDISIEIFVQ